jgi:hypothetical protein
VRSRRDRACLYDLESVAGRLRKGPIRTGDIYTLESWQNAVVLLDVRGENLSAELRGELGRRGIVFDPARAYTVATIDHVADVLAEERIGKAESRSDAGILLRDATISHLRKRGFGAA